MCKKLITLRDNMRFFSKVRDGVQFHPPKNLSTALVVEAAELVKYFNGLMRNKVSISHQQIPSALDQEITLEKIQYLS